MRIISQNGRINIPYESVILVEDNGSIFAYAAGLSLGRKIGTYDSSEAALKIMTFILEAAFKNQKAYVLP